jgi:4-hydroxyacetophenone monooxygenase
MTTTVDSAFIRRAVELADLNAVRVALFQHTKDPEIAELPMAINMDDAQRELLISKAVAWLEVNAGPGLPEEPPEDELRALCNLATKEEMGDLEFAARRDLPAFKPFPWYAQWPNGKPDLPEGFNAVVVGTGFSGLAMAVQLELLGIPYTVLERKAEAGGTWNINRYPDIRVDTISITYEYSFEKLYPWTEYFGRGKEVREYLQHIAKKYGVAEKIRYSSDLKKAVWDDARSVWTLEVETPNGIETMETNWVVSCTGTFANPKFPQFEGTESFEGEILHPARWPEGWDATGKRVAIIGNGSTGVQCLAPIAADATQVYVFQRTPQWISPRDKYGKHVEPEIRWLQDNFPGYWHWWRYMAIAGLFGTHGFILPDEEWVAKGGHWNPMNDKLREDLTAYIRAQVGDRDDLFEKLVPDYAPFSRRPVVDNGWYAALTRDNVQLVTDGIVRLHPKGIEAADGTVYEVDAIVTATGFDVAKYLWPADFIGSNGRSIHEFWASGDGPRAYLSMLVPGYPNMTMLYGPNSQPLSGGTGLPIWYVLWSAYTANCMIRMIEEGKSKVEVKQEAYLDYNERLDAEAANLLLMDDRGAPDKNYYVQGGRMQVNAPWYGPLYQHMCSNVDWDAIDIS